MSRGSRHDLPDLVDRQVERGLRNTTFSAAVAPADDDHTLPYVTLSRAAGVDATTYARAIARRTGFRLVDDDLVEAVARCAGVPRAVAITYDMNPHAQLEQMIADLPFMHLFSEDEYVRCLARTVHRFAETASSVFVGHAAGMILSPRRGVRVHLTAPMGARSRWHALTSGLDIEDARRQVEAEDARRQLFCERHWGFKIDGHHAADLVLDVTLASEDALASQVSEALRERLAVVGSARTADGRLTRMRTVNHRAPRLMP